MVPPPVPEQQAATARSRCGGAGSGDDRWTGGGAGCGGAGTSGWQRGRSDLGSR